MSQNVCAPLKVQMERNLMNKNEVSTIGPRSLDQAQINNNVKPISELKKPFGSTFLVNSCRKGGAKEKPAANSIGRKVSISTVALTGVRPPSSACGNNKAFEGIISKCPLWVATMHHVFRISKVQQPHFYSSRAQKIFCLHFRNK